jgi:hypothetical protein
MKSMQSSGRDMDSPLQNFDFSQRSDERKRPFGRF